MAKILVLGSHAESLIIFRFDMLCAMAKNNEVIACVPRASNNVQDKLKSISVKYIDIEMSRTGLNPFFDLLTIYKLHKIFIELKPDQIFAYTSKPVIFGSIAAKLAKVPTIYSMITGLGSYFIHNDFKTRIVRYIMSALYKIALHFNTAVFFQNPDDISDFVKYKIFNDPKRTVLTNGSGVNLKIFSTMSFSDNKISFLLTARIILAKGIIEYLTAAKNLKKRYPEIEFLLVGWFENKDESIAPEFIQKYVDTGIIKFLGKLDDVREALQQASVFVLPSYREGTPKTVIEAMACGRPIITTDVPGCRETVINNENGFLIPAKDINSLENAMEKFIINPDLIKKMGQRSRELAVTKYDVMQVNRMILQTMGHM